MIMPRSSPEAVSLFEESTPAGSDIVQKKMFGYPSCFVNGNLFLGLHGDDIILRLGPHRIEQFIQEEGARHFEPMPGRPMKEYAVVPEAVRDDGKRLTAYIADALAYARTLPPKESKPRAKRVRPKV